MNHITERILENFQISRRITVFPCLPDTSPERRRVGEGENSMSEKLRISVSRKDRSADYAVCRTVTLPQKLYARLFGKKQKATVIIPGDLISEVEVVEFHEEVRP